jgi:hypothetical protein
MTGTFFLIKGAQLVVKRSMISPNFFRGHFALYAICNFVKYDNSNFSTYQREFFL